ncbi:MAG: metallophosphoesterase family protein [Phycisphaerales bacterium JB043]
MPRIALISDIHGNLEALVATLRSVAETSPDMVICLGDVVGYGPNPSQCIEITQQACNAIVIGNHDEAVLFEDDPPGFNDAAAASIRFSREQLSSHHLDTLRTWPLRDDLAGLVVTHGSFGRRRFNYVTTPAIAQESFAGFVGRIGAIGHTHLPMIFVQPINGGEIKFVQPPAEAILKLPTDSRILVNPGSVGQPRDGNPDASWGMLDTDAATFQIKRVLYDIDTTQQKIKDAGLPQMLGERLAIGA